ncbi:hypothetical protein HK16_12475 [Acetobacter senegalensis]|uniref:Uncharacterized protein n=2 Tax=Acetobacter TaxID=434 RepID=A0A252EHU4_9PROT|nr:MULTISPECIES: hypothetical protein [Acetobacter]ATJ92831.1 hypothetical protein CIW82_18450 [Acetobacter tropicalis]MCP1196816.1 hypothetical protein [Acetobacter senegalensis]OUL66071.1 hypothetical protein HK16_12475 [Acetobacter senegalensis]
MMDPNDNTRTITQGVTYGFAEIAIGCTAIGLACSGHTTIAQWMMIPTTVTGMFAWGYRLTSSSP